MKTNRIIIILIVFCSLLIACNSYGKKEEFYGTEVYYTKEVNTEDAKRLGEFLVRSKFADGKTKSVQLTKNEENGHYVFRMVTNKKVQKEDTYDFLFKALAIQISDSVFAGKPVDFEVCDNTFNTIKTLSFQSK